MYVIPPKATYDRADHKKVVSTHKFYRGNIFGKVKGTKLCEKKLIRLPKFFHTCAVNYLKKIASIFCLQASQLSLFISFHIFHRYRYFHIKPAKHFIEQSSHIEKSQRRNNFSGLSKRIDVKCAK